jgi:hypothetical protein
MAMISRTPRFSSEDYGIILPFASFVKGSNDDDNTHIDDGATARNAAATTATTGVNGVDNNGSFRPSIP